MGTTELLHPRTDFKTVRSTLKYSNGHLNARADAGCLRTVLQPIFSVRHRRPVGYEGLARCAGPDGRDIPPSQLFSGSSAASLLTLDRQAALLHARNFFAVSDQANWLFLNLHPVELTEHAWKDGFFERLLHDTGIRAEQVVLEVLEEPVAGSDDLVAAIGDFRDMGVLVALDDFGAGHSNFERIWRLKPDIVKLDRSLIVQAEADRAIRRSLPSIVNILHQNGCLVVAEGVENQDQAMIALHADVDMVQGYYFARPFDITGAIPQCAVDWCALEAEMVERGSNAASVSRADLEALITHMYEAAQRYAAGESLEVFAKRVLELEGVIRFYAINQDGQQCYANLESPLFAVTEDPRYSPMTDARGASWRSRQYFRRACAVPGEVQVSNEYLSCADGHMCMTLSIAVGNGSEVRILCCDVKVN